MPEARGVPSVQFVTEAPRYVGPDRWVWEPAGPDYPPMPDWICSAQELGRALYVYAATVARVMMPKDACRFRLVAYDLATGGAVGAHEWCVSDETGKFIPNGEPMVVWNLTGGCAA